MTFKIFISHTTRFKKIATTLKNKLHSFGISCFVAHQDINISKAWQDEIENAINTCDAFVALLTEDFRASKWTDQEIGMALQRKISIFPIAIDDLMPHGFLERYQAYLPRHNGITTNSKNWDEMEMHCLAMNLFKMLLKDEKTGTKILETIVTKIKSATDYNHINTIVKYLSEVESLSPSLIIKLEKAFTDNKAVSKAYIAQTKLPVLINKWKDQFDKDKKNE